VKAYVEEKEGAYVSSADLYSAYMRWSEENATEPWKKNTFGLGMKERGYQSDYKSHDGHYGRY
jgi:D5 protein-like